MEKVNKNKIFTSGFSNTHTTHLYNELCRKHGWIEKQCGGCSYYAWFNYDWGLCSNRKSSFHLETVFEHFGCRSIVEEGWGGGHSFNDDPSCNTDDLIIVLERCRDLLQKKKTIPAIIKSCSRK